MLPRELLEDIMATLRPPDNYRPGTITERCGTCMFGGERCRSHSSNVRETTPYMVCDSFKAIEVSL